VTAADTVTARADGGQECATFAAMKTLGIALEAVNVALEALGAANDALALHTDRGHSGCEACVEVGVQLIAAEERLIAALTDGLRGHDLEGLKLPRVDALRARIDGSRPRIH